MHSIFTRGPRPQRPWTTSSAVTTLWRFPRPKSRERALQGGCIMESWNWESIALVVAWAAVVIAVISLIVTYKLRES